MRYPLWTGGLGENAIEAARLLATFAHFGQMDKGGEPYINHPAGVSQIALGIGLGKSRGGLDLDMGVVRQVAWLHDVLEDTNVTAAMMLELGVPETVVWSVQTLTRPKVKSEEGTARYYRRITEDPVALIVKQADIAHNLTPSRLARLDQETQERLRAKYAAALTALGLEGV